MGQAHGEGDVLARELAIEQAHVDRVYRELTAAGERAALVQADGLARGRTDRTGDVRDEELTGLFERDALVYRAAKRRADLDREHEGLVFGRLDLEHTGGRADGREARYVGRLGVRDDDYEPLVIDWRAPAAEPFYRATPTQPLGVIRRRVLRSRGQQVIGAEDDLMVAEAPEDMVVLGEGALLAALTRSRSGRMRDIVATIQAHQDEAIRAPARGVVEITGGPGTGKTVVALHRAAYLLYSDRRRFERGGVLVVGPSAAYTAYIERVLPSLGEDSVVLRSIGDVVDAVTAERVDPPAVAALKGSLKIRRVLARAARDVIPGAPDALRVMVTGHPVHLDRRVLDKVRSQVLRVHQRNSSGEAMLQALTAAAWRQVAEGDREEFFDVFREHRDVERFLHDWWRPVDPREVLLWLADAGRTGRYVAGVFSGADAQALAASYRQALDTGEWSVADAALVDDLAARLGPVPERVDTERGFYEVELLDDVEAEAIAAGQLRAGAGSEQSGAPYRTLRRGRELDPDARREALLHGRIDRPGEYAHVLVDEAQDLSPMQWRMLGRRGRGASWTVVGDAAQASWGDAAEASAAREEAFGRNARQTFHMGVNYRNAREIFAYAARVVLPQVPDADIPEAVREVGVEPVERRVSIGASSAPGGPPDATSSGVVAEAVAEAARALAAEVEGAIAVITPARWRAAVTDLEGAGDGRVTVVDPLSAKGLEYDATVVLDPEEIVAESPGGVRVLYVALTRAAHRMHVLTLA